MSSEWISVSLDYARRQFLYSFTQSVNSCCLPSLLLFLSPAGCRSYLVNVLVRQRLFSRPWPLAFCHLEELLVWLRWWIPIQDITQPWRPRVPAIFYWSIGTWWVAWLFRHKTWHGSRPWNNKLKRSMMLGKECCEMMLLDVFCVLKFSHVLEMFFRKKKPHFDAHHKFTAQQMRALNFLTAFNWGKRSQPIFGEVATTGPDKSVHTNPSGQHGILEMSSFHWITVDDWPDAFGNWTMLRSKTSLQILIKYDYLRIWNLIWFLIWFCGRVKDTSNQSDQTTCLNFRDFTNRTSIRCDDMKNFGFVIPFSLTLQIGYFFLVTKDFASSPWTLKEIFQEWHMVAYEAKLLQDGVLKHWVGLWFLHKQILICCSWKGGSIY